MKASVTRPALKAAVEALGELKKRYLEEHGWKYTCQTPGSTWLWRKVHMDDTYLCDTTMALVVEEALSTE